MLVRTTRGGTESGGMLGDHVRFLICPHCGGELVPAGRSLACVRAHAFDVARQGYVSLLGGKGRSVPGDTAGMVQARADFLAGEHFAPIADAVAGAGIRELSRGPGDAPGDPGCIVDIGAGTGYYLHALGQRLTTGVPRREGPPHGLIAVDVSKHAMRRAAQLYPELAPVVADTRQLVPVATESAAMILDAFAPREPVEIDRVLAPEGSVLVVLPHREHLGELVDTLGLLQVDPGKRARTEGKLGDAFTRVDEQQVSYEMSLGRTDLLRLVRMGPSAWHQNLEETEERLHAVPDPAVVSVSVSILTYRRS